MSFSRVVLVLMLVVASGRAGPAPFSVADFAAKAERREPVSVVFFGGSLTFGANASDPNLTSYRGRMMQWLREKYPHTPIQFHDAAIGGSGSQLGMFRLQRDVLNYRPDLVFLDFTVNDGADDAELPPTASYERILRNLLESDTAVMPVLMLFKWHAQNPDAARPPRHELHLKLADAYGSPAANVLDYVREKVRTGTQPADLWNLGDGAHPGDEGYQLFFEAVRDRFEKTVAEKTVGLIPEKTVLEDLYPKQSRLILTDSPPTDWKREKTFRTALWFDGMASRWMGDVMVASKKNKPAPLEIEFEGSMVGIFGERDGLSPAIKVWIDGKPVREPKAAADNFLWTTDTTRFAPAKKGSGNLFMWQLLARDLPDGKHTLKIEPQFDGADPDAEFRVESICSAGR